MSEPLNFNLGVPAGEFDLQPVWTAGPTFMLPPEHEPPHVWVVYSRDRGPYAISIHLTAEEAAQVAAKTGYAHAGKWPLGMELDEAIKAWEGRA